MLYLHTLCICIHISHNWTVMLHACSFVGVVRNSTLLRFCSGQWWQTYLLKPVCDDRCCDLCWRWSNNIILWKTTEQGHRNVTFLFSLKVKPVFSCTSCHYTSTHATWKRAAWAAVVTFPVPPCWELKLFSAAQDTTTTTPLHPSLLSWRFPRCPGWNLTFELCWVFT